jgi:rhodanese-related sulfurtransferase
MVELHFQPFMGLHAAAVRHRENFFFLFDVRSPSEYFRQGSTWPPTMSVFFELQRKEIELLKGKKASLI